MRQSNTRGKAGSSSLADLCTDLNHIANPQQIERLRNEISGNRLRLDNARGRVGAQLWKTLEGVQDSQGNVRLENLSADDLQQLRNLGLIELSNDAVSTLEHLQ